MGGMGKASERLETLQALMERLVAPNLTLDEAKDLRVRLFALTGVNPESASSNMPCDCRRDGPRSPECRHFAA